MIEIAALINSKRITIAKKIHNQRLLMIDKMLPLLLPLHFVTFIDINPKSIYNRTEVIDVLSYTNLAVIIPLNYSRDPAQIGK